MITIDHHGCAVNPPLLPNDTTPFHLCTPTQQLPMHFEAFTFVLTAGCWPLQSVSSSFKPPAPIEDYVVSFLDFYGEVIVFASFALAVFCVLMSG